MKTARRCRMKVLARSTYRRKRGELGVISLGVVDSDGTHYRSSSPVAGMPEMPDGVDTEQSTELQLERRVVDKSPAEGITLTIAPNHENRRRLRLSFVNETLIFSRIVSFAASDVPWEPRHLGCDLTSNQIASIEQECSEALLRHNKLVANKTLAHKWLSNEDNHYWRRYASPSLVEYGIGGGNDTTAERLIEAFGAQSVLCQKIRRVYQNAASLGRAKIARIVDEPNVISDHHSSTTKQEARKVGETLLPHYVHGRTIRTRGVLITTAMLTLAAKLRPDLISNKKRFLRLCRSLTSVPSWFVEACGHCW